MVNVSRHGSVEEFLQGSKVFRGADPVRTGLISSIAGSVADGTRKYDGYFWWTVSREDKVVGIASRTIPYGYVFSPMPNEAIDALIKSIALEDPEANEFAGPKSVIDFVTEIAGREVAETENELVYQLGTFTPSKIIGEVVLATEGDFDLVYSWVRDFIEETGLRDFDLENIVRSAVKARRYSILFVDHIPVSLGGRAEIHEIDGKLVGRVGPIYTPMKFRKHGYASSVTSAITQSLLDLGALPTLYTQASNPTSNRIYQDLGYVLVDENRHVIFA